MIPEEERLAAAARAKQHRAAAKARMCLELAQSTNAYAKPVVCEPYIPDSYVIRGADDVLIAGDIRSLNLAEAIVAFLNS